MAQTQSIGASLDAVKKTYRTRNGPVEAVADVSLAIEPGVFVSLVGPSGCGKSTLLMIISGLLPCTAGCAKIGGIEVRRPQINVGIVFQEPTLLEWRHALGNVMLQVEARGLDTSIYEKRASDLLSGVGLEDFQYSYPRELSGGMKQRVALCRALIHDPPLLLMDEPFGSLDALTREQLMIDLHKIWHERHKTILFVTHSIEEAVFLSQRVAVMTPRPGRIAEIVDIELPSPRTLGVKRTSEFQNYVAHIQSVFMRLGVLKEA